MRVVQPLLDVRTAFLAWIYVLRIAVCEQVDVDNEVC
jgi:hypothetical protein